MAETLATDDEDNITMDSLLRVLKNVTCILGILLSIVMFILGLANLETCPSQPGLPISIVLQGLFTIGIPIVYVIKYRFGLEIKMTVYLTIFIIFLIFALGNLIACSHLLKVCGCKEKVVYKGGVAFVVMLWLAVGVAVFAGLVKCFQYSQRDRVFPILN